jgi:monoterpene epsilon-lactone hydrolase
MSAQELEAVRGALRATELHLAGPVEAARENFTAMLAGVPVADDVTFSVAHVGGVGGLWSSTPETAASERVLVYLHGGAFAVGSADGYRSLWSALARGAGARGLGLDYRMAPEHPFPAAVDDAVTAYRRLLDDGRDPGAIALAGDSAGGGLTVSALLAIRDAGLPLPAGAVCLSPWTDLECAGESMTTKADEDLSLSADELRTLASRYLGDAAARDPLASPIHADLSGLPPLLIQVGSAELLLDDATRLAARAGASGVRTTLEVWPEMPHVWHLFAFMLGEGGEALASASAFLDHRLATRHAAEEMAR